MRRNALIALGNSNVSPANLDQVAATIRSYVGPDEMLERHARWAATELAIELN